jgi:hypothetical protein
MGKLPLFKRFPMSGIAFLVFLAMLLYALFIGGAKPAHAVPACGIDIWGRLSCPTCQQNPFQVNCGITNKYGRYVPYTHRLELYGEVIEASCQAWNRKNEFGLVIGTGISCRFNGNLYKIWDQYWHSDLGEYVYTLYELQY